MGEGILGAREASWLLTLAMFVGILAIAGRTICARWDGIFIDRDNRISLARFQLVLWTCLLISAFFTAGLTNIWLRGSDALTITVPPQIWALLGLGSFTAVAAPVIKEGQKRVAFQDPATPKLAASAGPQAVTAEIKTSQDLTNEGHYVKHVCVNQSPADARWVNMIMGDYEGAAHVDVSKLQQLIFTVVLVTAYGFAIWASMTAKGPFKAFSRGQQVVPCTARDQSCGIPGRQTAQ